MPVLDLDWIGKALAGGRYRVVAKLGEGGMGFVYRAQDANLGCEVVIKVPRPALLADAGFAERFAREIRALVQLTHPHIVKIQDVGKEDGVPYAVMQFLDGGSLEGRRPAAAGGQPAPSPPGSLHAWLKPVAQALDFIHQKGFIHRDLKPANILFDSAGNAYLSDFGVAKVIGASEKKTQGLTGSGMVLGTPEYMAPEVIQGDQFDGKIDQYALAVTVFEALAGQTPFTGPTPAATLLKHSSDPVPSLTSVRPELPASLSAALARGMAKKPTDRFQTCAAFAEAVLAACPGGTAGPRLVSGAEKADLICGGCAKKLQVGVKLAGKRFACPNCKALVFVDPRLFAAAPSSPSTETPQPLKSAPTEPLPRGAADSGSRLTTKALAILVLLAVAGAGGIWFWLNQNPDSAAGLTPSGASLSAGLAAGSPSSSLLASARPSKPDSEPTSKPEPTHGDERDPNSPTAANMVFEPGETQVVTFSLQRNGARGALKLEFAGPLAGYLRAPPTQLREGTSQVTVAVETLPSAPPGSHELIVRSVNPARRLGAFPVTVLPRPKVAVEIESAASVSLVAEDEAIVKVKVSRENYAGPVTVQLDGVPPHCRGKFTFRTPGRVVLESGQDAATFAVKAESDAPDASFPLSIHAQGEKKAATDTKNIAFALKALERVTVEPLAPITVYAGQGRPFRLKLSRTGGSEIRLSAVDGQGKPFLAELPRSVKLESGARQGDFGTLRTPADQKSEETLKGRLIADPQQRFVRLAGALTFEVRRIPLELGRLDLLGQEAGKRLGPPTALALLPDGRTLLVGDGQGRLARCRIDPENRTLECVAAAGDLEKKAIRQILVLGAGERAVTCAEDDSRLLVWDTDPRKDLKRIRTIDAQDPVKGLYYGAKESLEEVRTYHRLERAREPHHLRTWSLANGTKLRDSVTNVFEPESLPRWIDPRMELAWAPLPAQAGDPKKPKKLTDLVSKLAKPNVNLSYREPISFVPLEIEGHDSRFQRPPAAHHPLETNRLWRLATIESDGSIRVHDTTAGKPEFSIALAHAKARAAVFAADGKRLIVGCDDGSLRLMQIPEESDGSQMNSSPHAAADHEPAQEVRRSASRSGVGADVAFK